MSTFELFWPALAGGLLTALVCGPLGSLLVWRRLAYFGDSLSHAALLGVGLSLLLSLPGWMGIITVCLTMAVLLGLLMKRPELASDTLLTILATSSLSLGLIVTSFVDGLRVDLMAYLFGDLLALAPSDLLPLLIGAIGILGVVTWQWRGLVSSSINEELAAVDGLPVARLRLLLLILLALGGDGRDEGSGRVVNHGAAGDSRRGGPSLGAHAGANGRGRQRGRGHGRDGGTGQQPAMEPATGAGHRGGRRDDVCVGDTGDGESRARASPYYSLVESTLAGSGITSLPRKCSNSPRCPSATVSTSLSPASVKHTSTWRRSFRPGCRLTQPWLSQREIKATTP
jgi:hypothetical protein